MAGDFPLPAANGYSSFMAAQKKSFFPRLFAAMTKFTDRPFPWCLLPDWVWFAQGLIVLLFISVPALSLILAT